MKTILITIALLGLLACAGPKPLTVRVACDRTGTFTIAIPAGEPGVFKMPDCDARCRACGQECTAEVVEAK